MGMINGIKEIIKQQKAYQEATSLLVEDAENHGLDDIILGQTTRTFTEADEPEDMGPGSMEPEFEGEDPEMEDEKEEGSEPSDPEENDAGGGEPPEEVPETDMGAEAIDDPETEGPKEPTTPEADPDDIGNQSIDDSVPEGGDQPLSVPDADSLPDVVGAQTGEPAQDDNVVDVNLDLQSNTMRDVLPVPPAGAAQAVTSDTMDQHVDSGFGGDSGDLGDEPIGGGELEQATPPTGDVPPSPAEATAEGTDPTTGADTVQDGDTAEPVTEAITLGGDGGGAGNDGALSANDAAGGDTSADAGAAGSEEVPADTGVEDQATDGEGENPVTAAVRDKVAEEEGIDGEGTGGGNEELMKKLSSLTKSIEDAKQLVMKKIAT